MAMEKIEHQGFLIEPSELKDLIEGNLEPPRDAQAQVFQVSRSGMRFRVRLAVANIELSKASMTAEDVPMLFQNGIKEVVNQLKKSELETGKWYYFVYQNNGWQETSKNFTYLA